jgi:hypothetical protein
MVSSSEAFENQVQDQSLPGAVNNVEQVDSVSVEQTVSSRLALGVSFVGAFVFATVCFLLMGHYLLGAPRSLSFFEQAQERGHREVFSETVVVGSPGIYQRVQAREELNPAAGSDFLMFVWFRLKRVPVAGESMSLIGKFDAQRPHKPGFAVSLEGAPDGVRPRVYWNNESGQGRWYSFTSRVMKRKEWYLLAVSYSRDTFLSARLLEAGGDDAESLLGGHRVEPSFAAAAQADLLLGAYGSSRFRGHLGPFGILRGGSFEREIPAYLSAMSARPNDIPSSIDSSIIQLWASPLVDQGPHHLALETVTMAPVKNERVPSTIAPKVGPKELSPKQPKAKASATKRVKKNAKRKKTSSGKR